MTFSRRRLLALFATLGIALMPLKALAASGPQGLQISPVVVNLNASPGKTYAFRLSALNVTNNDLQLKPEANDFRAKDESGSPEVLLSGSAKATSMKDWIRFSDNNQFTLKPKASRYLDVSVIVPQNADPGGHYGVARFAQVGVEQSQQNVALSASWGTLILVRVSGNITEHLLVKDFFTSRHGVSSGWFEKSPIEFTERVENTGNVHVAPQGNVTIRDVFGKTVGSFAVNSESGNVLPGSIRRFTQTFTKPHMFGKYTAGLALSYGTHGETLLANLTFWVVPYKTIFLLLIFTVLAVTLLWQAIKRYNKRIIKKAMQNKNKE